jgi:hypothetical protein
MVDAVVWAVILAATAMCFSVYYRGRAELATAVSKNQIVFDRVANVKKDIHQLELEIQQLKSDPRMIESIARSQLGLIRPGEVVIRLGSEDEEDRSSKRLAGFEERSITEEKSSQREQTTTVEKSVTIKQPSTVRAEAARQLSEVRKQQAPLKSPNSVKPLRPPTARTLAQSQKALRPMTEVTRARTVAQSASGAKKLNRVGEAKDSGPSSRGTE